MLTLRRLACLLTVPAAVAGLVATAGPAFPAAPARTAAPATSAPGTFTALTPTRLIDTRHGVGAQAGVPAGGIAPGKRVTLAVLGDGPVPASGVGAVSLNLTALSPRTGGYLTAYPGNAATPPVSAGTGASISTLNLTAGRTVANATVLQPSGGRISIYNGSGAAIDVLLDVSGYYTPSAAGGVGNGGLVAVAPTRMLDTRTGNGAVRAAVGSRRNVSVLLTGRSPLPATGVGSVLVNVTETDASSSGYISAYDYDYSSTPTTSSLNFAAGQTVATLAVVNVEQDGEITLFNGSSGTVDLVVDVLAYLAPGGAYQAGAFGTVPVYRLFNGLQAGATAAGQTTTVPISGEGWTPPAGVSAVIVTVTVASPTAATGDLRVYPAGPNRPVVSTLNFVAGQNVANLAIVPVSSAGIDLFNESSGSVRLIVDIAGYVRSTDESPTAAPTSTSHYLADILDSPGTAGQQDCSADLAAGTPHPIHVIDVGAQTISSPLSAADPGVALALTGNPTVRLSYPQLVTDLNEYLTGLRSCGAHGQTVVVATNSDGGNFAVYPAVAAHTAARPAAQPYTAATTKGADWATQVVTPLTDGLPQDSGVTVVGGNDVEAGFAATSAQVKTWIAHYLAAESTTPLYYLGSLDACPTQWETAVDCQPVPTDDPDNATHQWQSVADYGAMLTAGNGRVLALPQLYLPLQVFQWANLSRRVPKIKYAGVLTQNARAPYSLTGMQAQTLFRSALTALGDSGLTAPTASTDLAAG